MVDRLIQEKRQKVLIAVAEKAPIVRTFGMKLSFNNDGQAVWDMPYNSGLDHTAGGIHGGGFATLLDNAGWFTVAPHYETWIATVEFQTRLLESVEGEDLRAVGEVIKLGKRIATAHMKLWSASNKLVAVGSGTFTVTNVALPG